MEGKNNFQPCWADGKEEGDRKRRNVRCGERAEWDMEEAPLSS